MVKAVADARGWPHNSHRDLHHAVRRLVEETGDARISNQFGNANALHGNFYEGRFPRFSVESYLGDVAELVEKLDRLNGAN